jgi:hypothetical protein
MHLSLATVFYVGRRTVGAVQARADIRNYLQAFDILPIDKQTLNDADALGGNDFEDNIQIAAAVAASVGRYCDTQCRRLFPCTGACVDAG